MFNAIAAAPLPAKLSELCRSKFFSVVADIAAKPLFWRANASAADTSNSGGGGSSNSSSSKKKSSKSSSSASAGEGPASGALEALWGLHETWQGLETGGRKFVKGVAVGLDEREACSVALGVVGRIRAGAARCDIYAKYDIVELGRDMLYMCDVYIYRVEKVQGRG